MKAPKQAPVRKLTEELGLAVGLLTRLPLPAFENRTKATIASAFWAYPLAGALVGAAAAAIFWLAATAGFSSVIPAVLAMAVSTLISGGFHEDGLSDFWDGLGGGRTRDDKLAIMRDSRIGTYGALALFFTLSLHIALIVNLYDYAGLATVAAALISMEIAARGSIALPVAFLGPARDRGLGHALAGLPQKTLVIAVFIAILIPIGLLGFDGVIMVAGATVGAAVITLLAGYFLDGFTGDVLGATVTTARLFALGALILHVLP